MSEMDVDGRIRRYWQRKELMLSDEDSKRLDELAASLEFRDATAGTPVPAIEFCSHLNCEGLMPFMEGAESHPIRLPCLNPDFRLSCVAACQ